MQIAKMKIEDLIPSDYNPRKDLQPGDPEYEKLERSIREFGYVEPIVWNRRTGRVVGGHQRLKILKAQGFKEITVSVVDLNETKEKALNLALNKIEGGWDIPKLKDLLQELSETDLDMELTGFGQEEIDNLLADLDIDDFFRDHEESADDDDEDEPEEETVVCPECGHEFKP